jgi:hypothetical protein
MSAVNSNASATIRRLITADIPVATSLMTSMWTEHAARTRLIDPQKNPHNAGQLVAACEIHAKEQGIPVVAGEIWSFNDASRSVFTKQAFAPDVTTWYKIVQERNS